MFSITRLNTLKKRGCYTKTFTKCFYIGKIDDRGHEISFFIEMWFIRNNVTKELNYNDNNIKYRTSFYNAKHLHHRPAGPARIVCYGDATIYAEIYCFHGKLHRTNGPAIRDFFMRSNSWYINDVLKRVRVYEYAKGKTLMDITFSDTQVYRVKVFTFLGVLKEEIYYNKFGSKDKIIIYYDEFGEIEIFPYWVYDKKQRDCVI